MPRDDRSHGVWVTKRGRGRAHGLGVMKRRRKDSGMSRDEFARLVRQLGLRVR